MYSGLFLFFFFYSPYLTVVFLNASVFTLFFLTVGFFLCENMANAVLLKGFLFELVVNKRIPMQFLTKVVLDFSFEVKVVSCEFP